MNQCKAIDELFVRSVGHLFVYAVLQNAHRTKPFEHFIGSSHLW